jgi:hypothetical protein
MSSAVTAEPMYRRRWPLGRPRRRLLAAIVLLLVASAIAVVVADPFAAGSGGGGSDNGSARALAEVTRRSLSSQTQVDGTLGYAGDYSVVNQRSGTITWLPAIGRVIRQGQTLYRVDDAPVLLLYGSTPAYLDLRTGESAWGA